MILENPLVRWDQAHLELAITVLMPYAVFGMLWQSYRYKATKYFAAGATACAVASVLLSSPCGCSSTQYLIDKAIQEFAVAAAIVLFGRAGLAWLLTSQKTEPGSESRPLKETADGWLVSDEDRFEKVFWLPPPRPIAFWSLLSGDLSSWRSAAFLITGTSVVLLGALLHSIPVVGVGLCAFFFHGRMMVGVLSDERRGVVKIGVIDKLENMHQAMPKIFKATMVCADGSQFVVGGSKRQVDRFLDEDGRVTVAALLSPKTMSGRVIGARRWKEEKN